MPNHYPDQHWAHSIICLNRRYVLHVCMYYLFGDWCVATKSRQSLQEDVDPSTLPMQRFYFISPLWIIFQCRSLEQKSPERNIAKNTVNYISLFAKRVCCGSYQYVPFFILLYFDVVTLYNGQSWPHSFRMFGYILCEFDLRLSKLLHVHYFIFKFLIVELRFLDIIS